MMSEEGRTIVCVTGASGYVASWIVKLLLQQGHTVRATVRDPCDPKKTEHLFALDGAKERLQVLKAELMDEGCFDDAVDGCRFVFHVASPVQFESANPQADLLDPAVKGTLNLLKACAKPNSTVNRVVLTSSMAAVLFNGNPLTSHSVVDHTWFSDPNLCQQSQFWYILSKTLAEKAAWEFAKANGIDLVVINPGIVIGPFLHSTSNYSMEVIMDLIKGEKTYPTYCFVDVRDVANAHIQAAKLPSACGRYLLVERVVPLSEALKILHDLDPTLCPKMCIQNSMPHESVQSSAVYQVSNEGAKALGMEFLIPAAISMKDAIQSLKEKQVLM